MNFNNSNPFTALGRPLVAGNAVAGDFRHGASVTATLRAMESAGVVRTLAEPNLTAISGKSATFIAGGEFPVPAGYYLRTDHGRWHRTMLQTSASRNSASRSTLRRS